MKLYLFNHQNSDAGWGMHIEGESTMFGTVMQYVSLRLLGVDKNHPQLIKAREWIKKHGVQPVSPPGEILSGSFEFVRLEV
jgi:lanosterol synthase